VVRSWLNQGIMHPGDILTLTGWILGSIAISVFLSLYFLKIGIKKLEAGDRN